MTLISTPGWVHFPLRALGGGPPPVTAGERSHSPAVSAVRRSLSVFESVFLRLKSTWIILSSVSFSSKNLNTIQVPLVLSTAL
ncbi:hypothetical protein NQZ68_002933 [Dissostichus eleginoides]|nr:hypothetical protein NQZ68_002933 [Dissostichus eleginoides]